jgi:hypothetical protein
MKGALFALPYGSENGEAPTVWFPDLCHCLADVWERCWFAVIGMDRYCAKEHIQNR